MTNSTARKGTTAEANGAAYRLDALGRSLDNPEYNPFENPRLHAEMKRDNEATKAKHQAEHRAADLQRVRDSQSSTTRVSDAMADLRRVMVDSAEIFDATPTLSHVSQFADCRGAERYATTFGVLMRAVLAVPPQVVLPPIIGGEVSLNMLIALVGASGAGKGAADKTAAAAVHISPGERGTPVALPMIPIGTGEGLNRTYAHTERDSDSRQMVLRWHTDRALFGCRDIATLDALIARRGATLLPELLKSYMGEELGFANADKDRRVILPMHSYRLCLSAGVQPDNGLILLNDQALRDGVPQRFVWTPVRPGSVRERRNPDTGTIDPITVMVPTFGIDPYRIDLDDPCGNPLVPIDIESSIVQQIIDADAAKDLDPFGRCGDPLAGHRLLAQLKIAAAIAILHNRMDIDAEHWGLAQLLMSVSSAVADVVAVESEFAAHRDAVRQGELDGHRLAAADNVRNADTLQTVMDRIVRYLDGGQPEWVSHSAIYRSVTSKLRGYFGDAIIALTDGKQIESRKKMRGSQEVVEYRLKPTTP